MLNMPNLHKLSKRPKLKGKIYYIELKEKKKKKPIPRIRWLGMTN
jgi:hypothetical protein